MSFLALGLYGRQGHDESGALAGLAFGGDVAAVKLDQGTHDELAQRSAFYRNLLAGLGEDEVEAAAGRIEALATIGGGTTASAWNRQNGAGEGHDDTVYAGDTAQIVAEIKDLLDTRIRPAVAQDGGDITFSRFDEATGVVFLHMRGACSGCPSSSATLKAGVENMLKHYVPEGTGVEQTL